MTAYHLTPTSLPYPAFNEAKEKRRKVLEAVRERRKMIYARYWKKLHITRSPEFAI